MTWWGLDETSGVLEFDEPALELHLEWVGGRSLAWWCDDQGHCLGIVRAGVA